MERMLTFLRMNSAVLPLSLAMLDLRVLPNIQAQEQGRFRRNCNSVVVNVEELTSLQFVSETHFCASSRVRKRMKATPLLFLVCLSFITVTLHKKIGKTVKMERKTEHNLTLLFFRIFRKFCAGRYVLARRAGWIRTPCSCSALNHDSCHRRNSTHISLKHKLLGQVTFLHFCSQIISFL